MDSLFKPGMGFSVRQHAGPSERFASGAFDSQIGKVLPMTYEGAPTGYGRLVSAVVSEDGRSVELTFAMVDAPEDEQRG